MPLRRRPATIRVERTQVGGVPIFWAEGPAPFVAMIMFRVGRADETLVTSGLTHLVEHLAIPIKQPSSIEVNGTVTSTETMFWTAGSRAAALQAFQGILAGLSELSLERLELEREILRTEAASVSPDPVRTAALLRFGPLGYGLVAYDELGLYRVGAGEVEQWWRDRFTAGNAAIWMTSRPGRDLELSLPRGERRPAPAPEPIPGLELPAHNTAGSSGGVFASFVIERSFQARAVVNIVEQRLRQRLRFERGLTYGAQALYEPMSPDLAHVVIWADCLDARATEVRDELMSLLRTLAAEGPTEEELREGSDALSASAIDPLETTMFLQARASEEISGSETYTVKELVAERAAVSPEEAAGALARALPSLLLTTPEGSGDRLPDLAPYQQTSSRRVSGRRHRLRGLHVKSELRKLELLAGDEGISLISPRGEALTVPFGECAAVQRWPDGRRSLWGTDGFYVEVDPQQWRRGGKVIALIDERVPGELVVPMEPELASRKAAVEAVTNEKVRRRWVTADELDALPSHLAEGETVLTAGEASRGLKVGVLAATDRRLLFLYFEDVVAEVPYEAVTAVRSKPGSLLSDNELVVSTASDEQKFTSISPKERLDELVAILEQRRQGTV